jgi:hypothetical protein
MAVGDSDGVSDVIVKVGSWEGRIIGGIEGCKGKAEVSVVFCVVFERIKVGKGVGGWSNAVVGAADDESSVGGIVDGPLVGIAEVESSVGSPEGLTVRTVGLEDEAMVGVAEAKVHGAEVGADDVV